MLIGIDIIDSANLRITNNGLSTSQIGIKNIHTSASKNGGKLLMVGNTLNHCSIGGIDITVYGDPATLISMQSGCTISDNMDITS